MTSIKYIFTLVLLFFFHIAFTQTASVHGSVKVDGITTEFVSIQIDELSVGTSSDAHGHYHLSDIPYGNYTLTASMVGYEKVSQAITLSKQHKTLDVDFELNETLNFLDQVVVTGTKTFKRQTNSPVIVNVMNSEALNDVQACSLSDGLKFQPGLRVETDCQTCNYTQLRMNGLAGGYSQILVNGRPIFSPLTGLYGLEQLPVNMIDRIEVVRGGGSSLYGSSAIGGTVNVITKVPKEDSYQLNYTYQNINSQSSDHMIGGNATLVSDNKNTGVSFFLNRRQRDFYDHNDDNFSELPLIENTSVGMNGVFLTGDNQKLEVSLSNIHEYRFGGEMVDKAAYLTQQSEERTHNVWMGSADYQINFNNDNSSLITYGAWQNTDRKHYTGIFPDDSLGILNHLANAPYGNSTTTTLQAGLQLNHRIARFLSGSNVFTFGVEYVSDEVFDEITAYNYLIDQTTKDLGIFLQSDWEILPSLNLLSGFRIDNHNLVDDLVGSPRVSLLYKYKDNTQFRLNYSTGFRAPQAFDTDLHIAFAGGGISRVMLSPDLEPEFSKSMSASINYDKPTDHFIAGFTLEGFYTTLDDVFYLQPIGEDEFGEVFEKRNGTQATVQGLTLELRANYDRKAQLEAGFTIQSSEFQDAVDYIEGVAPIKDFIRTPNNYGFATLSLTPNKRINANINYVYTGEMIVPHFAGAPNQTIDEIITSEAFSELSCKLGYTFPVKRFESNIELYAGVKNMFNAYQESFDIGKNRDSNFVYGPSLPPSFYVGVKLASF